MAKIFRLGLILLLTLLFGCGSPGSPNDLIKSTPPPLVDQVASSGTQREPTKPTEPSINSSAPLPTDKVAPKGKRDLVKKTPEMAGKNDHLNVFPTTKRSPVSRVAPQRRDDDEDHVGEAEQPASDTPCEGIPPNVDSTVLNFLGCEMIQIIVQPDEVNSFLLKPKPDESLPAINRLGAYPIELDGQGFNLEGTNLAKFQQLVFSEKSYHFDMEKRCRFEPNVGLHFIKGDKSVEVIFSVPCNLWLFVYGEEKKLEDFDPVQSQLNFLNSLFPINNQEDGETLEDTLEVPTTGTSI